ncbi:DUF4097 family beta strand repeat-containing protein [Georgenia sp. SYP-B2076]|uniref:DUF4097 family beta strand repeat-containing protein n=1 Tax=Georgenia sp. SYP-B2076 TaxID=2495881 RepID=UPI000F8EBF23|nr:DUF4097 family beta strand repeat-containing protein [Georgenia sp. SYP-B2076]
MATRSWIVPGPSTHDVEDVAALRVQLVAGEVTVEGHDAGHVQVAVEEVSGNPLELTVEDGRLTIGYPFLGWDGWVKRLRSFRSTDTARLRVLVPRGTAVTVATAVADAHVSGVGEDVSLSTASGHLAVSASRGAAALRSASGAISVQGHDGPVRVSTAAGRTTVAGQLPRVEVTSVAGAVDVATTSSASMVDLATVSGAMHVTLPAGTGLSLTARSLSGAVRVDGADRRSAGLGATTVDDRSGADVCFLTTRSVSGALAVERRPASPSTPGTITPEARP